jgi:hypothetical protein
MHGMLLRGVAIASVSTLRASFEELDKRIRPIINKKHCVKSVATLEWCISGSISGIAGL